MKVRAVFIDDDQYMLTAYQRMLRHTEFDCVFLTEPTAIWQLAGLDEVDIVLADQQMSLLSGIELLTQLARQYPAIKRVLISGDLNFAYRQLGVLQLDAALEKPVSKTLLLQCLTQLSRTL